jgi:putative glutamine amidotransferase
MENKPRILIAPRTGDHSSGLETQFIFRGHSDAVQVAGGYSFSPNLPSSEFDQETYGHFLRELYDMASGIMLVGGTDCDPARYGEERKEGTDNPVEERDFTDFMLMEWAIADDKPILAVCAGSQRFNVYHNGTLHQNIFEELEGVDPNHNEKNNRTRGVHFVEVVSENELVNQFYGDRRSFGVNSTHKQAVREVGQGLETILRSPDGIVEGTMRPDLSFAVGLQYHPEAMWKEPGQEFHLNVYASLVNHAKNFGA